ncbi:helix-turn-helix domain-containing protein [Rhodopseudomonas sp. P2A-2r]|uniref:helix-turn-helix domain-containing protein n=1 Tax=Rhodopseudomonas sp. P2A-2r TaxID=2991972 RepID=UPI002234C9F8|nr:helix-turn-helix transcriptional regulator [Rhodopseudomonas sp. P2A-2r]UZE47943.1 helix-turn-helix domain-containing protein [Rhodopseudomonas sp. P2A-2r]
MTGTSNAAFGEKVGKSGEAIRRYRAGEREPDNDTMAKIFVETAGLVTPNDWVGVGPRAAEQQPISEQVIS